MPPKRLPVLLTFEQLKDAGVPYSRSHIWKLEARNAFPKSVKIGTGRSGAVAWRASEIEAWVQKRIDARK